jgi:hypothetical protein
VKLHSENLLRESACARGRKRERKRDIKERGKRRMMGQSFVSVTDDRDSPFPASVFYIQLNTWKLFNRILKI